MLSRSFRKDTVRSRQKASTSCDGGDWTLAVVGVIGAVSAIVLLAGATPVAEAGTAGVATPLVVAAWAGVGASAVGAGVALGKCIGG